MRTALTQPPPPIVGVSRVLSTEPVDRTRPTRGRPTPADAAAPASPPAQGGARSAPGTPAAQPPRTRTRPGSGPPAVGRDQSRAELARSLATPKALFTGHGRHPQSPMAVGERTSHQPRRCQVPDASPPQARTPKQTPARPRVRSPPGKTPGQTGNARHRSQATVRNPRPTNRTLKPKHALNSHALVSLAIFE